jgi:hypothetical protein
LTKFIVTIEKEDNVENLLIGKQLVYVMLRQNEQKSTESFHTLSTYPLDAKLYKSINERKPKEMKEENKWINQICRKT